ncbi:MAG: hypothetical protein LBR44_10725 [Clostridiales Family XIII bacterium]|jgi:hypothetical protein|nr:hypothetical protein [Clostridiales Family XIII bacterium]
MMFQSLASIGITCTRAILQASDGAPAGPGLFCERITGAYDLFGAHFAPQDLVLLFAGAPEPPALEAGRTSVENAFHTTVSHQSLVEIVNNVVSRVMLVGSPSFTYRDAVYVTQVLRKLGVPDAQTFLREAKRVLSESARLERLDTLYVHGAKTLREWGQRPGAGATAREARAGGAAPPETARAAGQGAAATPEAPAAGLLQGILSRLHTREVAAAMAAAARGAAMPTAAAAYWLPAAALEKTLRGERIDRLRAAALGTPPPLRVHPQGTAYEMPGALPPPKTGEEAVGRIVCGALLRTADAAKAALSRAAAGAMQLSAASVARAAGAVFGQAIERRREALAAASLPQDPSAPVLSYGAAGLERAGFEAAEIRLLEQISLQREAAPGQGADAPGATEILHEAELLRGALAETRAHEEARAQGLRVQAGPTPAANGSPAGIPGEAPGERLRGLDAAGLDALDGLLRPGGGAEAAEAPEAGMASLPPAPPFVHPEPGAPTAEDGGAGAPDADAQLLAALQEVDRKNQEAAARYEAALQAEKAPSGGAAPQESGLMRTAREAAAFLEDPDAALRLIENAQADARPGGALPPKAEMLLRQAPPEIRAFYEQILAPAGAPGAGAATPLKPAGLPELNADAAQAMRAAARTEHLRLARETQTLRETERIIEREAAQAAGQAEARRRPGGAAAEPGAARRVHRPQQPAGVPEGMLLRMAQEAAQAGRAWPEAPEPQEIIVREKTIEHEIERQVKEAQRTAADEIERVVGKALQSQMDSLAGRVYTQVERRLSFERARRGK